MSNFIARFWSQVMLACFACVASLAFPAAALAQGVSGTKPHNATFPALVVIFCLALGLILIARSANRSPDMKLEPLDDD